MKNEMKKKNAFPKWKNNKGGMINMNIEYGWGLSIVLYEYFDLDSHSKTWIKHINADEENKTTTKHMHKFRLKKKYDSHEGMAAYEVIL